MQILWRKCCNDLEHGSNQVTYFHIQQYSFWTLSLAWPHKHSNAMSASYWLFVTVKMPTLRFVLIPCASICPNFVNFVSHEDIRAYRSHFMLSRVCITRNHISYKYLHMWWGAVCCWIQNNCWERMDCHHVSFRLSKSFLARRYRKMTPQHFDRHYLTKIFLLKRGAFQNICVAGGSALSNRLCQAVGR